MKQYETLESTRVIWCPQDDRLVLLVKKDNKVIGLNFMQGDELDHFRIIYGSPDAKLTKFYLQVEQFIKGDSEMDKINNVIWAWCNLDDLLKLEI